MFKREPWLGRDASALQRFANGRDQLGQANGFFQKIKRADARRLNRRFNRAMARHHYHRHRELTGGRPLFEKRDAVHIWHPNVEQH